MSFDNDLIITAMDRFVWFILLIVSTHLVTELTRVTGYARGPRNDVVVINDTLLQPRQVQNMIFYPGQNYDLYDPPKRYEMQEFHTNTQQQGANVETNEAIINPAATANNAQQGFLFNFRPLIDSIFDIPISTLRAVNNLVARLTGNYQHSPTHPIAAQKSVQSAASPALVMHLNSIGGVGGGNVDRKSGKTSVLREVNA